MQLSTHRKWDPFFHRLRAYLAIVALITVMLMKMAHAVDALAIGGHEGKMEALVDDAHIIKLFRSGQVSEIRLVDPVESVRASPDGSLLLLFDSKDDLNSNGEPTGTRTPLVIITDSSGRELFRRDNVFRAACAPDGARVALIYGTYNEDLGFDPRGVSVYDVRSGNESKILCTGRNIAWRKDDGKLYIETLSGSRRQIVAYSPDTDSVESTPYKGFEFSDDGKFYLTPDGEGGPPIHVIETATGRAVGVFREDDQAPFETPLRWLAGSSILLTATYKNDAFRYQAVDVVTAERLSVGGSRVVSVDKARRQATVLTKIGLVTVSTGDSPATVGGAINPELDK